jgi:4-hydroxy-tetrahydrodipicolinate synthase
VSTELAGGIVPPLVTPLRPDGEVDVASLSNLVEHLIGAGVDGLFPLGSTGDVSYLSDRQRDVVARTVVDAAQGRVPVLAGTIELSTARMRERAHALEDAGVDAVVVTAPSYGLNDAREIERHFRLIAEAVGIPVVAYDIPIRGLPKLAPDMLVRLGKDGAIAAVKDSSTDVTGLRWLVELNRAAGTPLTIFTGLETMGDAAVVWGADGSVPGLSNVDAAGHVAVWRAARGGDFATAGAEQRRLIRLFDIVRQARGRSFDVSGAGAFKVAMRLQGIIEHSTVPEPLEPLGEEVEGRIAALVREAGLVAP